MASGSKGKSDKSRRKIFFLGTLTVFFVFILIALQSSGWQQWQGEKPMPVKEDIDALLRTQNVTIVALTEALTRRSRNQAARQYAPIVTKDAKPQEVPLPQLENLASKISSEAKQLSYSSHRRNMTSWSPIRLTKDDWVVYLRIQKTGSQTLWLTLVDVFDGSVWGSPRCQKGVFCGYMCEQVLTAAFRQVRRERKCQLFVRAHAGMRDFQTAAALTPFVQRFRWIAFLREPIARARSEHEHITNGLVAQFGPHVFGKAWDYNFTNRNRASLDDWMNCKQCQVGASNRQTRYLAALAPTGILEKESDETLLEKAIENLYKCDFVGVLDHFADSMFLLRETFPTQLKRFTSYTLSLHPKKGLRPQPPSEKTLARLAELNSLDTQLYAHAIDIFQQRWAIALNSIPPDRRRLRFRPSPSAPGGRRRQQHQKYILS